jgi:hypothetical protein
MHIGRVEIGLDWSDLVTVRLLRRWVAARTEQGAPFPALVALAHELGCPAEAAVALGSLFQLTEGCLGRPLEAECCCSRAIGEDERAVLLMIAAAPAPGLPAATSEIPHGLPGALAWAASSVRRMLGPGAGHPRRPLADSCPFGSAPAAREVGAMAGNE